MNNVDNKSSVPVIKRVKTAELSSQAHSGRLNAFHLTGSLTDGSVFDVYLDTWDDVTAFLSNVKTTLRVIAINGGGVEYEKLPSTLAALFFQFSALEESYLYGVVTQKVVSVRSMYNACTKFIKSNFEDYASSSSADFSYFIVNNKSLTEAAGIGMLDLLSTTTAISPFGGTLFENLDTRQYYAPNLKNISQFAVNSRNKIWDLSNLGATFGGGATISRAFDNCADNAVVNLSGIEFEEGCVWTNCFANTAGVVLIMNQPTFQPLGVSDSGIENLAQMQVPPSLLLQYKDDPYWGVLGDRIVAPVEVPYVSAMGNSFINTGIVPTSSTMMEVDVQSTNTSAVSFVAGSRIAAATQAFSIVDLFNSNGGWRLDVGNTQSSSTTFAPDIVEGERVKIKLTSDEVSINGIAKSITPQTIVSSLPLYLGNCNTDGTPYQVGIVGNIYKSLIDDVTFTPAVYNGIGGFFDSRTGVWLRSVGAEDFVEDVFAYTSLEIVDFTYPEIPVNGGTATPSYTIRASWESGSQSGTEIIQANDSRVSISFNGEVSPFSWSDKSKGVIQAPTMGTTLGGRSSGEVTITVIFDEIETSASVSSVVQTTNTRAPSSVQSLRPTNADGSAYILPIPAAGTGSNPMYMSWQIQYTYLSGAISYADNLGTLIDSRTYTSVDNVNKTIGVDSQGTVTEGTRVVDVSVLYMEGGKTVTDIFTTYQASNQLVSCEIINITPHQGTSSEELQMPISAGGIQSPSYIRMSWQVEKRYSSGDSETLNNVGAVSIEQINGFSGSSNQFYVEDRLANKGSARSTAGEIHYQTSTGIYRKEAFTLTQAENVSWYDRIELTPSSLSYVADGGEKEVEVRLYAEFSSGTVLNYDYGGIHLQVDGSGFTRGSLYDPRTIVASENSSTSSRSGSAQASFEGIYSNTISLAQEAGEAPPPKQTIYVYKEFEGLFTSAPVTNTDGLSISLTPSGATFVIPMGQTSVDCLGYGEESISSIVPMEDSNSKYVIQY